MPSLEKNLNKPLKHVLHASTSKRFMYYVLLALLCGRHNFRKYFIPLKGKLQASWYNKMCVFCVIGCTEQTEKERGREGEKGRKIHPTFSYIFPTTLKLSN